MSFDVTREFGVPDEIGDMTRSLENGRDVKIDILDDYIRTPDVRNHPEHFWCPNIAVQYINLYFRTIPEFLIISVISSKNSEQHSVTNIHNSHSTISSTNVKRADPTGSRTI